jgi:hypothetical protein
VDDFPVLTAGPTPDVEPDGWELTVTDGSSTRTRDTFHALP